MADNLVRDVAHELKRYVDLQRREGGWEPSTTGQAPRKGYEYNTREKDSVRRYVRRHPHGATSARKGGGKGGGRDKTAVLDKGLAKALRRDLAKSDAQLERKLASSTRPAASPWRSYRAETFSAKTLGTPEYARRVGRTAPPAQGGGRALTAAQARYREERRHTSAAALAGTTQLVTLASRALVRAEETMLRRHPELRPETPPSPSPSPSPSPPLPAEPWANHAVEDEQGSRSPVVRVMANHAVEDEQDSRSPAVRVTAPADANAYSPDGTHRHRRDRPTASASPSRQRRVLTPATRAGPLSREQGRWAPPRALSRDSLLADLLADGGGAEVGAPRTAGDRGPQGHRPRRSSRGDQPHDTRSGSRSTGGTHGGSRRLGSSTRVPGGGPQPGDPSTPAATERRPQHGEAPPLGALPGSGDFMFRGGLSASALALVQAHARDTLAEARAVRGHADVLLREAQAERQLRGEAAGVAVRTMERARTLKDRHDEGVRRVVEEVVGGQLQGSLAAIGEMVDVSRTQDRHDRRRRELNDTLVGEFLADVTAARRVAALERGEASEAGGPRPAPGTAVAPGEDTLGGSQASWAGDSTLRLTRSTLAGSAPAGPHWTSASLASTLSATLLDGEASLIAAVRKGDLASVRSMLPADRDALLDRDGHGRTALHVAATLGHDKILQLLLAHGADALAETPSGFAAIHYAAGRGTLGCVQKLMAMGCSPGVRTADGITPLHCAAANGRANVVRYLLANQAPADAKDRGGVTPLAEATRHRHDECVALLRAATGVGPRAHDGEAWQAAAPREGLLQEQGTDYLLDSIREDALRDWHASAAD